MTNRRKSYGERETIILEKALELFGEFGVKVSMDKLTKDIGMSKKTLYKMYSSKEELYIAAVNYLFDRIKTQEKAILEDDSLTYMEKLKGILGAMPARYTHIDFHKMYALRNKFPEVYDEVEKRLETGWEPTVALLEEGMKNGELREFSIPIFQVMMEATLERFLASDVLVQNDIAYTDALRTVVDMMVEGIRA